MGVSGFSETRSYPYAGTVIWHALLRCVEKAGWKVTDSQNYSTLKVRTGMTPLCPLGINIDISLGAAGSGSSVNVAAQARGQMIDYGQAAKEGGRLFLLLEEELAYPHPRGPIAPSHVCPACAASLKDTAKFCAACGTPAPAKPTPAPSYACTACGASLKDTAKFCTACGAPSPAKPAAAATSVCLACGTAASPGKAFCHECGAPAAPPVPPAPPADPVCAACGQTLKAGAKFCRSCGQPTGQ